MIAWDPSKLPATTRGWVEGVPGSHGDAGVAGRAFQGADAVFWLIPPDPHAANLHVYVDFTRPACDAIRAHDVRHVVSVSALGRGTPFAGWAGLVTASVAMDDLIAGTGVAFRALAMPSFMDNLPRQVPAIKGQGAFFGPLSAGRKLPTCATRDIAAAATPLVDGSSAGRADVPVFGPEDLSCNDMAEVMSDVLGRPVRYQQIPVDVFKAGLKGGGMTDAFVRGYVEMMRTKDEGMDNAEVRTSASSSPTRFAEGCQTVREPAVIS